MIHTVYDLIWFLPCVFVVLMFTILLSMAAMAIVVWLCHAVCSVWNYFNNK